MLRAGCMTLRRIGQSSAQRRVPHSSLAMATPFWLASPPRKRGVAFWLDSWKSRSCSSGSSSPRGICWRILLGTPCLLIFKCSEAFAPDSAPSPQYRSPATPVHNPESALPTESDNFRLERTRLEAKRVAVAARHPVPCGCSNGSTGQYDDSARARVLKFGRGLAKCISQL